MFRYAPEDKAEAAGAHYPSIGVSNLLSGNRDVLIPDGTPRMLRRQENAAADADAPLDVIQLTPYQNQAAQEPPRPSWSRLPKAK